MPSLGFLKILGIGKGAKALKIAEAGATGIKSSKMAAFITELPIVRIAAGSAIGVAILDTWNSTVGAVSKILGVDSDTSAMLIGIVVVACLALVVSSVSSLRRSMRERKADREYERYWRRY